MYGTGAVMNKFELASMIKKAKPVNREAFICEKCRGMTVLDLGCIRHSAEFILKDTNWLHKRIKEVAKKVTGIDYLPEEIAKINSCGYEIIYGDVTKPLDIAEKFDVIVAGDLLEHLTSFEGFFSNCKMLLKPDGIMIITTPNPFFCGEFYYVAFKKNFVVNPEHTCWIDPQCLSQLSGRFGFRIAEAAYIKNFWPLEKIICETEGHQYDILNGKWENDSIIFTKKRNFFKNIFGPFYFFYKIFSGTNSKLCRYSDYLAVLKRE